MIVMTKIRKLRQRSTLLLALIMIALFSSVVSIDAQVLKKKKALRYRSVSSGMPSGYTQVGNTDLCYRIGGDSYYYDNSIDIQGKFNNYYYGSTYANGGYRVAMQVGNNAAMNLDCLNGSTIDGVKFEAEVIAQADLARVCYYITNTNDKDTTVSLGIHADVMIGNNDSAPIIRKVDTLGNTYGLALLDGNGAQLCVLFGTGLTGVTGVSDFWFGYYYLNWEAYQMVGNYSSGECYMLENSSYDSGMGWCWKNRTIPAGATVTFSWLIGVGDVKLEPNSSFEASPEDPDAWNDLSRLHVLTMEGEYESPAGLSGRIEYAVEESEEWIALTEMLESGSTFNDTVRAMFNPELSNHTIRFRTVEQVGNTTLLPSIVYPDVSFHDVSGISDKTYTGDSLFQTELSCDLEATKYAAKNYQNNVNVGTASFNIEGVFPYTIGRKTYTFTINPQPFSGEVVLAENSFVYNGQSFTPEWQFSNEHYANLEYDRDYTLSWADNCLPGTATLTVTGKNNYTGSLSANFTIDKAPLTDNLYTLTLPEEDITYDEQSHGATITKSEGVGEPTVYYQKQGDNTPTTTQPSEPGDYIVYLEFADGSLYYGRERTQVGTFSIYQFSAEEWATLQTVLPQLTAMGWSQPWNVSQGMKSVSSLQGLTIEQGHVTGLNLAGQNLTGLFPYAVLALPQLQHLDLTANHLSGDLGLTAYAFAQQNPTLMANLQVLNISGNQFSGNLGIFANCFPNLHTLDASGNCLEDVYPMIPSSVTTLDISNQTISRVVPLHLSNLSVETIATKVPTILLYDHQNQTFTPNINLLCTTQDNSWGMIMSYRNGQLAVPYVSEQNTYYGQDGDTLHVAVVDNNGTREGSTFRIALSFDEGDGNFDGQVNILDLQSMLIFMFEEYANKPYNFTASNLWKDEVINVQDAVCMVNKLLDDNASPIRMAHHAKQNTESSSEADASVFVEEGLLTIASAVPVSAFDIVVSTSQAGDLLPELKNKGFTCAIRQSNGQTHLVGYSLSGATLPIGKTAICRMIGGAVTYAMLSDMDAQEIKVTTNSTVTKLQYSIFHKQPKHEVYRIPLGAGHAIGIDATGKKTMTKDEK